MEDEILPFDKAILPLRYNNKEETNLTMNQERTGKNSVPYFAGKYIMIFKSF